MLILWLLAYGACELWLLLRFTLEIYTKGQLNFFGSSIFDGDDRLCVDIWYEKIKKFDELVWDRTIFTGYGDRIVCYMEFWMLLVRFRLS